MTVYDIQSRDLSQSYQMKDRECHTDISTSSLTCGVWRVAYSEQGETRCIQKSCELLYHDLPSTESLLISRLPDNCLVRNRSLSFRLRDIQIYSQSFMLRGIQILLQSVIYTDDHSNTIADCWGNHRLVKYIHIPDQDNSTNSCVHFPSFCTVLI